MKIKPLTLFKKAVFLGCLFTLCLAQELSAALLHDPTLTWQTLHTPHFTIHFHDGEKSLAQSLVPIVENGHKVLTQELKWEPQEKTDIVLTDRMDFSNGWATPYPRNHITLITTPPADLITLEDHKNWLELVFIHEYVHILHLDKANSAPKNLRQIFGRFPVLFPNLFQPSWLKEGLATYFETDKKQGIGRGQSSLYRAMMRLELQDGLKPVSQVNMPTTEWPNGTAHYLYGVYFYQFIDEQYGREKIDQLIDDFSENLIPFMINTTTKRVLHKKYPQLWDEFEAYLADRFKDEIASIESTGIRAGEPLTKSGNFSGFPRVLESGDLYYIEDSRYNKSRLMHLAPGSAKAEEITRVRGHYFDAHPEAGILLIQTERFNNTNLFNDIYHIDPETGDETRLTEGGRYRYAIWSRNGGQIIALHYQLGQHALHLLDSNGSLIKVLWQGDDDTVVGPFSLAPDGSKLVATLWYPEGQWDLAELDLNSQQWERLTHSTEIEAHPHYSSDGKQLIFTAEYDGRYNIYQMGLKSKEAKQLTQVMGAALYPAITTDGGTLYYSGLTTKGYQLYRLPLSEPTRTRSIPQQPDTMAAAPTTTEIETTITDYDPSSDLIPSWWFPHLLLTEERTEIGLFTGGNDALWQHFYQLFVAHDTLNNWQLGTAWYRYERWQTSFQVFGSRLKQFYLDGNNQVKRVRNDDTLIMAIERPFMKIERQWALHAGLIHERESDALVNSPYLPLPDYKNTLGGVAISYNDTKKFSRSISPMDGRIINLVFEDYDLANSYYEGDVIKLDWREYLRLGQQQLLSLRATVGWSDNLAHPFQLGGTSDVLATLPGNPASPIPFDNYDYPLRGYKEGLPQLRGQHMVLTDIEWRFPIRRIERTLMAPPIGIQQIHGKLFYSEAAIWNVGNHPDDSYKSSGMEITMELVAGYMLPVDLRIGFARGMDRIGDKQFYLELGLGL